MADDITPGEASIERGGPQMNLREARAIAGDRDARDGADVARGSGRDEMASRGASGGTGNQRANERPPDDRPFTDSETALGGADAVQKTTWGVGHGTEPTGTQEHAPVGLRKGEGDVVARVAPGGRGLSPLVVVVAVIAVLAFLMYAFGIFRR